MRLMAKKTLEDAVTVYHRKVQKALVPEQIHEYLKDIECVSETCYDFFKYVQTGVKLQLSEHLSHSILANNIVDNLLYLIVNELEAWSNLKRIADNKLFDLLSADQNLKDQRRLDYHMMLAAEQRIKNKGK